MGQPLGRRPPSSLRLGARMRAVRLAATHSARCAPLTPMTDETPSEERRTVYRTFTDSTGAQWMVWKVAEAAVSEIRGRTRNMESASLPKAWLVFLSSETGETRRLSPVPRSWRKLTVDELQALVREAKPFQRRG